MRNFTFLIFLKSRRRQKVSQNNLEYLLNILCFIAKWNVWTNSSSFTFFRIEMIKLHAHFYEVVKGF